MSIRFIAYSFRQFQETAILSQFHHKTLCFFIRYRPTTNRTIEGMSADGGGYILAASHIIPPETPDENIFALFTEAGVSKQDIYDRAARIRQTM